MSAGDEGSGATAYLAAPTGTVGDGNTSVDEVDGTLLRTGGTSSPVLPAL